MKEVNICPVCKGQTFQEKLKVKDHTVSHEHFSIKECTGCTLKITSPRPDDGDLDQYYRSDAYISHSGKASGLIDSLYLQARRYTLRWKVKLLKKYSPGKHLLDYGCGTGEFIHYSQSHGFEVAGIEPSEVANKKANLYFGKQTVFSNISSLNTKFDVITLWHVLEHVPDLDTTLLRLAEKLNPDGKILIAVPNPNSWDSVYYGENWAGYDTPRHLWHFTQRSMELLMENNKLRLIKVIPMKLDAFYIGLLSEKYKHHGKSTIGGMINAFIKGLNSNAKAHKNGEFSSLIYIVKNEN